ncbi:hypothetical protein H2203_005951 [Taxawa tesnikishii (nom. ined.)]|nr:hypothetical protein H2203_005951 [Dothideales sp. JES 119]
MPGSTWFKEQLAEADMHDSHQQLRTILGGIRYFFVLGKDAVAAHTTGESKRWPMLGRVSLDYAVVSHGRDRQRRHEDAAPRKPHTRSTGDGPVKQEAVPDREQASVPVKTVKDVADAHIAFFQTLRGQRKFVEFIAPAPSGFDARNIESLAALGVDYGAMPAVKASLRDVFYSRMQELMTAVGKSPVAWLRLSLTLRDAIIYKEAAIHVVGALRPGALDAPSNTRTSGERMFWRNNKTVAKALEVKGLELRERRWIVDHALFQNTFLDDEDKPITIESNHEGFVMISLWRDWFSSQLSANDSHGLYNPNVANLYRTIERGGDAYLPVGEVIKRFTEQEIDTDDVINDLAMLKKYASEQVAPLLQTGLQYKDAAKLSYLTAVELTDEDVPWEKEADLEREE